MRHYPLSALQQQMLTELYTAITKPKAWHQADANAGRGILPKGTTRSAQAVRCRALTRLEARGLVTRYHRVWESEGRTYQDSYTSSVALTAEGRATAEQLVRARAPQSTRARKKTRTDDGLLC